MTPKKINTIFKKLLAAHPDPSTELLYHSEFELLISVILSAQATDVSVNKATQTLYKIANTPQAILNLGEEGLKKHIKTIGLFNTKAKNIIKTCQRLTDDFNRKIPRTRAELESLPGVGRKTANVILNTLFGEPTIAVDTHIFRVSNRTGLAPGKNVLIVEKNLLRITPKKFLHDAHHALILHGRYTCTARAPKCSSCPIFDECEYEEKQ